MFNHPAFYTACLTLLLSIILQYKSRTGWAVLSLFIAACSLRWFVGHLDPFLADWDERYYALVARNMMDDPFHPMLKTEILFPYDIKAWCCNHIWLHKQPLYMWQMALSMKIFGVSEFTMRYPSILMGALMVPMLYRITLLYTKNAWLAFAAAFMFCCSCYHLQLCD